METSLHNAKLWGADTVLLVPGVVNPEFDNPQYGVLNASLGLNFDSYKVLHMNDAPAFDVTIVPSTVAPSGCGEIGTPPVAPALANAYFALTGKRVRSLPLLENLT